jgi:hypothetical protein
MLRSERRESWSMSISRQASTTCEFRQVIGFMRLPGIEVGSIRFP